MNYYDLHGLVGWLDEYVSCNTSEPFLSNYRLQTPVSGSKKPAKDGQLIFHKAGEYSSKDGQFKYLSI